MEITDVPTENENLVHSKIPFLKIFVLTSIFGELDQRIKRSFLGFLCYFFTFLTNKPYPNFGSYERSLGDDFNDIHKFVYNTKMITNVVIFRKNFKFFIFLHRNI